MVDTPIGTNSPNYTLVSGDVGATIYCRVTATNASGSTNAISNVVGPITSAVAPANAGGANLPNIADTTPEVTVAVSCTTGTWTGDPTITYAYQWKRGGTNVGTNSASYTPVVGDIGATLQCVVTATNGAGSSSATSNTTGAVAAAPAGGSTWNPADATANMELSGGNLTAQTDDSAGFAWQGVRGTLSHANGSGKWYFEITIVDGGNFVSSESLMMIGLCDATYIIDAGGSGPGAVDSKGFTYRVNISGFASAQTNTVFYPSGGYAEHAEGDVIGIACDMSGSTPKVWIRDNGTWEEGDPVAGTLGLDIGATAGALFPFVLMQWQAVSPITVTLKTTATFAATPPTGFSAWG